MCRGVLILLFGRALKRDFIFVLIGQFYVTREEGIVLDVNKYGFEMVKSIHYRDDMCFNSYIFVL